VSFVPDATSDDGWMHLSLMCQVDHICDGRMQPCGMIIPQLGWNERILRPRIGLAFTHVIDSMIPFAKLKVVDEYFAVTVRNVTPQVREFMKQAKPEIIQPVVPDSHPYNRNLLLGP
jgi:hypothetical protein